MTKTIEPDTKRQLQYVIQELNNYTKIFSEMNIQHAMVENMLCSLKGTAIKQQNFA